MNEWNIQSRSAVCQACGQRFGQKANYHTLLFTDRGEFRREDLCAQCWCAHYSEGASDRKGFVSHWQGVFTLPPAPPPEAIQKETAETLLYKALRRNDPHLAAACFILAVMLERKRVFKVKGQRQEEGRKLLVYEHARTGDVVVVGDPGLQLHQLAGVQRQVANLLECGLDLDPDPEPAGPEQADANHTFPHVGMDETPAQR